VKVIRSRQEVTIEILVSARALRRIDISGEGFK
jgi:hypothetical protein